MQINKYLDRDTAISDDGEVLNKIEIIKLIEKALNDKATNSSTALNVELLSSLDIESLGGTLNNLLKQKDNFLADNLDWLRNLSHKD